ncbi:hypothetical protein HY641_02985 [Candidatus Woesearchaeota archaeon]|nr:hypothetical protein [Candidatus Woesearchaeota archaeon]
MRLVVDSNVLMRFFWQKSATRSLLLKTGLDQLSVEFALQEIEKHRERICQQTRISRQEFKEVKNELTTVVRFVPLGDYREFLRKAGQVSPDPEDVDFFALAMKIQAPLWSDEGRLKSQQAVRVCSTNDLLSDPEFLNLIYPDDG